MSRSRRAPVLRQNQRRSVAWEKRYAQHCWRRAVRDAIQRGDDPPVRPEEVFDPRNICDWRWWRPQDERAMRK